MNAEGQSVCWNRCEAQRYEERPPVHAIGEEATENHPECLRRQVDTHRERSPGLGPTRLRYNDGREGPGTRVG